jgi:putative FmdB family regulatory protein
MPTYEYVCEKCGHQFEQVQSIAEKPLATCPKAQCPRKTWGRGKIKRAISGGAGLLFKGTGFYITDYRSEGYKAAAKKDTSAAPSGAGSDTKPAAKTETASAGKTEGKPSPSKRPAT